MPSISRKSAAVALAVVGVAGLSLASASQLGVNSASLGAGTDVVASCDDAIGVSFANGFSAGAYQVTGVQLSDVDSDCAGLNVSVTLTDDAGTVLSQVSNAPLTLTGTSATVAGLTAPAADVENVAVVIAG